MTGTTTTHMEIFMTSSYGAAVTSNAAAWVRQNRKNYDQRVQQLREAIVHIPASDLIDHYNTTYDRRWRNSSDYGDLRMLWRSKAELKMLRQEIWRELSRRQGITLTDDVLIPRRG